MRKRRLHAMSHNLASTNGKVAMFCTGDRDAAWHKLGQRTAQAVAWSEALLLAGLDWSVVKKQLYARNPLGEVVDIPLFGTFRSDDGRYLGAVGEGYHIIQNAQAFTDCDALLAQANGAHYESAGALGDGEQIWVMARIPEADFTIDGGDEHKTYLLVATSHDGSMSYTFKLVDERVVCANTLAIALGERSTTFRMRHTANAQARLEVALRQLAEIKDAAISLKDRMLRLADTKLTRQSVEQIMDRLFPKSENEAANQTRRNQTLTQVLSLYEANDNNAHPSIKGTAYNLLNAVTEYTDHLRTARGKGSEPSQVAIARSESALFGSGDRLKTQAMEIITEVAGRHDNRSLLEKVAEQPVARA